MPITAREGGSQHIELIPEGVERAVCYAVIDLGTHENPFYDKKNRKVRFQWELPDHRIEVERDGKQVDLPRAISKPFTLSLHDKSNLRPFLESWRGRKFTDDETQGFDVTNVCGACCMLQIVHSVSKKGKTFAEVQSVMPLYKGMEKFEPENPRQVFSLEDFAPGEPIEIPETIPEWIRKEIMESIEWKKQEGPERDEPEAMFNDKPFEPERDEPEDETLPF